MDFHISQKGPERVGQRPRNISCSRHRGHTYTAARCLARRAGTINTTQRAPQRRTLETTPRMFSNHSSHEWFRLTSLGERAHSRAELLQFVCNYSALFHSQRGTVGVRQTMLYARFRRPEPATPLPRQTYVRLMLGIYWGARGGAGERGTEG